MTKLHSREWFKEMEIEDSPEEKAIKSELRKKIEAEIAAAPTWWDSATPEERAEAVAKCKESMKNFNEEMVKVDSMIAAFNKDFRITRSNQKP